MPSSSPRLGSRVNRATPPRASTTVTPSPWTSLSAYDVTRGEGAGRSGRALTGAAGDVGLEPRWRRIARRERPHDAGHPERVEPATAASTIMPPGPGDVRSTTPRTCRNADHVANADALGRDRPGRCAKCAGVDRRRPPATSGRRAAKVPGVRRGTGTCAPTQHTALVRLWSRSGAGRPSGSPAAHSTNVFDPPGEVAERLNAPVSKTGMGVSVHRGFESPPLRFCDVSGHVSHMSWDIGLSSGSSASGRASCFGCGSRARVSEGTPAPAGGRRGRSVRGQAREVLQEAVLTRPGNIRSPGAVWRACARPESDQNRHHQRQDERCDRAPQHDRPISENA